MRLSRFLAIVNGTKVFSHSVWIATIDDDKGNLVVRNRKGKETDSHLLTVASLYNLNIVDKEPYKKRNK
jgi:hypothetical protein